MVFKILVLLLLCALYLPKLRPRSAQLSNYSLATFYNHVNRGTRAGGALYKDTVLLLRVRSPMSGSA